MKIEEIMELWSEDVKIDNTELDKESLKIPNLHGRWLGIMSKERLKLRGLVVKKQKLSKDLTEYYLGRLNNPDDLEKINREPFPKTVLKSEVSQYVDADEEMVNLNLKKSYQEEVCEVLEEIIKSINNRQWNIRNAIEHRKFTQGVT